MIKKQHKNYRWLLLVLISLGLGLLISPFIYNWQERQKETFLEVSFVDPHQAIIFWKTDHDTLGSVRYGSAPNKRTQSATQTSSVPGQIHTVVINDIPTEGYYVTIHNQSDSRFLRPKPFKITFDPSTYE